MWLKLLGGDYLSLFGQSFIVNPRRLEGEETWEIKVVGVHGITAVLFVCKSEEEAYEKLDKLMDYIANAKTCVMELSGFEASLHRAHIT